MSGLLVGGSILRKFDTRKYAIDRATRLYAALLPALALTLALQWAGTSIDCKAADGPAAIAANLALIQIFSEHLLCNNVSLWSLSSEAYCYLIGPCLILALRDRSPKAALLCAVLLVPAIWVATPIRSTPLFTLLLWLCGLIPWFFRVKLNAWIAAVPVLAVLVAGRLHHFPSEMLEEIVLAAAFALLLCSDFQQRTPPLKEAAHTLAAFSYSLYLVQMPIAQLAGWAVGRQSLPNGQISSYLIYAGFLALIVLVAWIFGQLFEKQTPRLRNMVLARTTATSQP